MISSASGRGDEKFTLATAALIHVWIGFFMAKNLNTKNTKILFLGMERQYFVVTCLITKFKE